MSWRTKVNPRQLLRNRKVSLIAVSHRNVLKRVFTSTEDNDFEVEEDVEESVPPTKGNKKRKQEEQPEKSEFNLPKTMLTPRDDFKANLN